MLHRRLLALAAGVIPVLAGASAAVADNLVELVPGLDPGSTVIQVNGTAAGNTIVLFSLPDGSAAVLRLSGLDIRLALISAADLQNDLVVVLGQDGNDLIDASALNAPAGLEIYGGDGDDIIVGSNGPDHLLGEGGNDLIYGLGGNDIIEGGNGFGDMLFGGDGDDSVIDNDGVASADGGEGSDTISILFSAAWDNDRVANNQRRCTNRITGGGGDDLVILQILGSPIFFNVDGDGGTSNPGVIADEIDTFGPVAPGSIFRNFEVTSFSP